MLKYYYIFCAILLVILNGCNSGKINDAVTFGKDKLLVVTSYLHYRDDVKLHYPELKLTIDGNGSYAWDFFDKDKIVWSHILTGKLNQDQLEEIENGLKKEYLRLKLSGYSIMIKNELGNTEKRVFYRVLADDSNYSYNYLAFDSTIMPPTVIYSVLKQCEYAKAFDAIQPKQ
jgi:hypothetical protein